MGLKSKIWSYRSSKYLLLTLLILMLVGGFITYRYSLLSHFQNAEHFDEGIFYGTIGVAVATVV